MSKKFSEIIEEQVLKTEAILKYVAKKPINDPIIFMYLTLALNSLRTVRYAAKKLDGGSAPSAIDKQAAFIQMKDFFKGVESVFERHRKNGG